MTTIPASYNSDEENQMSNSRPVRAAVKINPHRPAPAVPSQPQPTAARVLRPRNASSPATNLMAAHPSAASAADAGVPVKRKRRSLEATAAVAAAMMARQAKLGRRSMPAAAAPLPAARQPLVAMHLKKQRTILQK